LDDGVMLLLLLLLAVCIASGIPVSIYGTLARQ
jgi:hypothetical protein